MKREQLQRFVKRSEKVSGVLTVKDRVCDTGDRASDPAPSECPDTPRSAGQSFHWKHLLVCNLLSSQQTEMNALERKLLSVMWTFLNKHRQSSFGIQINSVWTICSNYHEQDFFFFKRTAIVPYVCSRKKEHVHVSDSHAFKGLVEMKVVNLELIDHHRTVFDCVVRIRTGAEREQDTHYSGRRSVTGGESVVMTFVAAPQSAMVANIITL